MRKHKKNYLYIKINRWDSGLQTILLVLLKLTITVFLYCKFLGGIYMKLKRVKSDLQCDINNIINLRNDGMRYKDIAKIYNKQFHLSEFLQIQLFQEN